MEYRKKIISILITIIVLSTIYIGVLKVERVKAIRGPPDNINVLITSDWQNGGNYPVTDINNNCDVDLLFHDGDQVNDPSVQSEWDTFHTNWDAVTGTGTILYRNYTHGNHESLYWITVCGSPPYEDLQWPNRSRLTPAYDPSYGHFPTWLNNTRIGPNWTYTYGNVIFIGLPLAYRECVGVEAVYSIETPFLNWFNDTVQNNTDKNIIVLCHLSIHTGTQDYYYGLIEQNDLMWILNNYNIVAWVYGHNHDEPSASLVNGTYHVHASRGTPSGPRKSIMFNFTNGSSNIDISVRNHASSSWTETISGFDTLPLDFAFNPYYDDSEDIEFVSVDGGINGTSTNDSTPTFEWTKVSSSTLYHFQIATDSGFSSIVVDLDDINENNYPTEYDETGTNVTFILPTANKLSSFTTYYIRVRSLYVSGGG